MLQYYGLLIQDAIELNTQTTKTSHMKVLQEIGRGTASSDQYDLLENIRININKQWYRDKHKDVVSLKPVDASTIVQWRESHDKWKFVPTWL